MHNFDKPVTNNSCSSNVLSHSDFVIPACPSRMLSVFFFRRTPDPPKVEE